MVEGNAQAPTAEGLDEKALSGNSRRRKDNRVNVQVVMLSSRNGHNFTEEKVRRVSSGKKSSLEWHL